VTPGEGDIARQQDGSAHCSLDLLNVLPGKADALAKQHYRTMTTYSQGEENV
jgi:hypothetical protein